MDKRLTYIFGDSIMKGVLLDAETKGYVLRPLEGMKAIEERWPLHLVNRSRFGCTIEKGAPIVQRTIQNDPAVSFVVLEYGGNDCDFDWVDVARTPEEEHLCRTPLPKFLKIYRELIAWLLDRGVVPIIMNLPPIDGSRYVDFLVRERGIERERLMRFLEEPEKVTRFHELYSLQIDRLAYETGLYLVDVRSPFLNLKRLGNYLCADGIHPNEAGHAIIYESFKRFIERVPEKLKRILEGEKDPDFIREAQLRYRGLSIEGAGAFAASADTAEGLSSC